MVGIRKRSGKVYTTLVPDVTRTTIRAIIRQRVPKGSTISSDSFTIYDGLVTSGDRHYRINHDRRFAEG